MTINKFWEFILSLESEYGSYRKKIMNRFSLSAAETDILMFLSHNMIPARIFQEYAKYQSRKYRPR